MNKNKAYDFEIDNYSELELINYFKLDQPITKSIIYSKIDDLINSLNAPTTKMEKDFLIFLKNAKIKLLAYVKNLNTKPVNYNIINSQSKTDGSDHNVIQQKHIPIINTNEYKYPSGVINPIEKRVTTKIINIDTIFRQNYQATNPSNCTWVLPDYVSNVVSMKVVAMELPNFWYTISSKNNTNSFKISLYNMQGQINNTQTIVIPDGNYSSNIFAVTLNNFFRDTQNGLEFLVADIDSVNKKTIIRCRDPSDDNPNFFPSPYNPLDTRYSPDFYFTVNFVDEINITDPQLKYKNFQKSLGWWLGFKQISYTVKSSNTNTTTSTNSNETITYSGYLASETSYGSSLQNYVFVEINDFNNNCITDTIISSTADAYIGNNIIARITIPVTSNDIVYNNNSDRIFKTREYLGPVTIKKLNIRLLNKFGETIDMNYNDYSIAIEVQMLY